MLIVLLLICLKEYFTYINFRLSKSIEYFVYSLFIVVKKYVTNITWLLILYLNESTSHLIRLRCCNFIRDATKTLKINKRRRKEYTQIFILIQEYESCKEKIKR